MSEPPPSSPDSVVAMIRCDDCGHMVPEDNIAIHQVTACNARARRPAERSPSSEGIRQRPRTRREDQHHSTQPATTSYPATAAAASLPTADSRPPASLPTPAQNPPTAQRGNPKRDDSDKDVIDLVNDEDEVQMVEEWPCPRCTLLNPVSENVCAACQHKRGGGERAADPVRRERLMEDSPQFMQRQQGSPGSFVGGGALVGGLMGAAGAMLRGGSVGSGALEGAMSGAMGGVIMDSVLRNPTPPPQAASMPARSSNNDRRQQQQRQPRVSSYRVTRSSNPNGYVRTTTVIRSPDGRVRTVVGGPGGVDPILGMMMANSLNPGSPFLRQDIDGMSYEQLLQAFGDGSENRGAEEGTIASLPTAPVEEPAADPESDHAKCSICLELFKKGDSRKTLPCLHGFHADCVDKWLRHNGSCPICKHGVSS